MVENIEDIKKHIENYEELSKEEKELALEKIYRIQMKSKEIDRTLEEIIQKQIEIKELKKQEDK